ncbi:ParB N-terminal domain-containing protein [Stappia sp. ES.058]|uniref:methyltransferase domain-containing protein n=1 Tax=Stappia sp. ES.058 TaxID=1881061 RepID=UPI00087DCF0D|nr:ParB N-terminal domain-containing protein [Stappia sp. ES.058]SDU08176.1 ParB-like nuclease domain-containing protein [Stappia sp. ES.058]
MELVSPETVVADPHNPRKTDPARLELVRLSLEKFGFLLPLYATNSGVLLSGHQRAVAARQLGWQLPVVFRQKDERDAHGVNLTFNRATNDFRLTDTDHSRLPIEALFSRLQDLPDAPDPYPCLTMEQWSVRELLSRNVDRFERYAANAARQLAAYNVQMPIVITPHGDVLNGVGRLQEASARRQDMIDCVVLKPDQDADLARFILNKLSMDFSFSDGFKDVLRNNAFRRARQRRRSLGSGYLFAFSVKRCRDFSIGKHRKELKALYGERLLDFGAGQGDEARMLRKIGVKVTTFEPYRAPGKKPTVTAGRRSAFRFLKAVSQQLPFSSVMLSSVLNSVPFETDREHVVTICAALCSPDTTLFAAARSRKDPNWKECSTGIGLGETSSRSARFVLSDEPGLAVSELNADPKIQKYFQPSEFEALFERHFGAVTIGEHINNVTAVCQRPHPVNPARLRKALEFEFDLPYADGRMGLVEEALAAFSKRLGVEL